MKKYYIKTLKEIRTVKEYEIEAESLRQAKDTAYDYSEDDKEGNIIMEDCSDFEILEAREIN